MHPSTVAVVAVIALAGLASSNRVVASGNVVELDAPGTLAAIERENPEHSRRIHAILTAASKMPCQDSEFGRVIRTAFDARDGLCTLQLLTSLPAKRVLQFTLDQTHYRATVRVASDGKVRPATAGATAPRAAGGLARSAGSCTRIV